MKTQSISNCSIVMLANNGCNFTRYAFFSILNATVLPKELFFVNNGSTDDTLALVKEYEDAFRNAGIDFIYSYNAENLGCSKARNDAWEKVTTPYTIFMDNDVAVCTPDWLEVLMSEFTSDNVALVGPKILYPFAPTPIQCAGLLISPLGRICFRGRGSDRNCEDYQISRPVHALISACWMMRTDLRDSIGLLDELFHPVQYEDIDLCLRAHQAGMEIRYTANVEMYHFEGITTASFGKDEYKRNIAANSLKFRKKWHKYYSTFADELSEKDHIWLKNSQLGLTRELVISDR